MEIEIITTKKQLTKALLNQMQRANLKTLIEGTSLGYIINGKKGVYKVILIEHLGLYYIIESNWRKRPKSVSRPVGRFYIYIYIKNLILLINVILGGISIKRDYHRPLIRFIYNYVQKLNKGR